MKKIVLGVITGIFVTAAAMVSYAGEWKADENGWWYDNGDGTYPVNQWRWIDGNSDGISECYYFNSEGYCLVNTMTPDGYQVNNQGAWIVDHIIQTQETVRQNRIELDENTLERLVSVTNYIYTSYNTDLISNGAFPANIQLSDLTSKQKAFLVYAYQYNWKDSRFKEAKVNGYYDFNRITKNDLVDVMSDLLGTVSSSDLKAVMNGYVLKNINGSYYFNATGDFGDAGYFYLSPRNASAFMENGRLKIMGNVVQANQDPYAWEYVPVRTFVASYIPNGGECLNGYRFEQLIVQ